MQTLRARLIFSHILPLLLVAPLIAVTLIYLLETQILITDLSRQISERAVLIARAINPESGIITNPNQAQAFLLSLSRVVNGQIYLLSPDGTLIASSGTDGSDMPLQLKELAAASETYGEVQIVYGISEQNVAVLTPVTDFNQNLIGVVAVSESIHGVASQFSRLRWLVLGAIGFEVLIAAAVGYSLARRLAGPISRVSDAVSDIAEGSRVEPIPIEGPLEIRRLSASINSLSEQLRALEDIRQRSLANIVHELGRPLGAIRAAIHTLRQESGSDPQIREELLAGVDNEIENMGPLLDDLTQIHGRTTGSLRLHLRMIDLKTWLPSILLPWRAAAHEKGLDWQTEIPSTLPSLEIDAERIGQVIGNLLSNAIKYTPAGGSVITSAGTRLGEVWVQIQDTGSGIPPEEQQHVFEPFYRSSSTKRFPQGLGLGLTIARDLAEAHGGSLDLDSQPGRGCTFTLRLPLPEE
jgi:signal transduction histidine kinase